MVTKETQKAHKQYQGFLDDVSKLMQEKGIKPTWKTFKKDDFWEAVGEGKHRAIVTLIVEGDIEPYEELFEEISKKYELVDSGINTNYLTDEDELQLGFPLIDCLRPMETTKEKVKRIKDAITQESGTVKGSLNKGNAEVKFDNEPSKELKETLEKEGFKLEDDSYKMTREMIGEYDEFVGSADKIFYVNLAKVLGI